MSEIKSITLGGLDNQASPYAAEEGALALSVGIVKKEAGLEAVPGGDVVMRFPSELRLMHIHQWNGLRILIFTRGDTELLYCEYPKEPPAALTLGDLTPLHTFAASEPIAHLACVDNALAVATSEGLRYATLDGTQYTWLGAAPTTPDVYPYITVQKATTENLADIEGSDQRTLLALNETVQLPGAYEAIDAVLTAEQPANYRPLDFIAADNTEGGNPLLTFANKCVESIDTLRSELHRRGLFTAPFFLRAAYRLPDGSHLPATAPVPLIPTTTYNPLLAVTHLEIDDSNKTNNDALLTLRTVMPAAHAFLRILGHDHRWDDIITHLDIYATQETQDFTDTRETVSAIHNSASTSLVPHYIHSPEGTPESAERLPLATLSATRAPEEPRHIHFMREETWENCTNHDNPFGGTLGYDLSCIAAIPKPYKIKYGVGYDNMDADMRAAIDSELGDMKAEYGFWTWYQPTRPIPLEYIRIILGKVANIATVRLYRYTRAATVESIDDSILGFVELHRTDGEKASEVFTRQGNYYLLDSVATSELHDGGTIDLRLPHLHLDKLASRPRLEETAVRPYPMQAEALISLNNRLHVAVGRQRPETPPPYTLYTALYTTSGTREEQEALAVEIKERGQTRLAPVGRETDDRRLLIDHALHYYYYPSTAATALLIATYDHSIGTPIQGGLASDFFLETVGYSLQRVELQEHETLQGAYAFNDFQPLRPTREITDDDEKQHYAIRYRVPEETTTRQKENIRTWVQQEITEYGLDIVLNEETDLTPGRHVLTDTLLLSDSPAWQPVGNKLIQSGANNPYTFAAAATSLLPCREIKTIASATKPLSQGQFGQYPLYAFTSDGIFALAVGQDGTLGAASAVSQDVLLSPESLTQLDQSILFATRRGLMEISGSQVESVSQKLRGHDDTAALSLTSSDKTYDGKPLLPLLCDLAGLPESLAPAPHFEQYLDGARIRYDYPRRLIYVYHPLHPLAYVLTLDGGAWGMIESRMRYNAPSYTSALVVEEIDQDTHALVDRSATADDEGESVPFLLLTRPMHLGRPSVKKTIEQLMTRGNYPEGSVRVVLLASDDLRRWAITHKSADDRIEGLSGTPYKWYRAALYGHLQERDALHGLDIDLTPRLNNKLR